MAIDQSLFSLLPENLIIIIISMLPLKDAIRTSILSKEWQDLWRLRTSIEINECYFIPLFNQNKHNHNHQVLNENVQFSCINFGRKWLHFRSKNYSNISDFTLVLSNPMTYHLDINNFIQFAISCGTKSLKLDFSSCDWDDQLPSYNVENYSKQFTLPRLIYQYQELESLELVSCDFRGNKFSNIGRVLRNISLGWIEIASASVLKNLLRNCPLLESLRLFKCFGSTIYVIESSSLKYLVVESCCDVLHITVIAPNLTRIKYFGYYLEFGMGCFPSLQEADLDFGLVNIFDVENGDNILPLLRSVYFANVLKVCSYITQVLSFVLESSRLEGQARIKELTIKTPFHEFEFGGMLYLLNSYPLLEKLCFEIVAQQPIFEEEMAPYVDWNAKTFWSPTTKFYQNGCVKNKRLKQIEIKGFRGNHNELNFLFSVLSHASGLKTLILRWANEHARIASMALRRLIMQQTKRVKVIIIP